jgi:hypothetical protein
MKERQPLSKLALEVLACLPLEGTGAGAALPDIVHDCFKSPMYGHESKAFTQPQRVEEVHAAIDEIRKQIPMPTQLLSQWDCDDSGIGKIQHYALTRGGMKWAKEQLGVQSCQ